MLTAKDPGLCADCTQVNRIMMILLFVVLYPVPLLSAGNREERIVIVCTLLNIFSHTMISQSTQKANMCPRDYIQQIDSSDILFYLLLFT